MAKAKKLDVEQLQEGLAQYAGEFTEVMIGICAAIESLERRRAKIAARLERAEELLERAAEFTLKHGAPIAQRWHEDLATFRRGEWE